MIRNKTKTVILMLLSESKTTSIDDCLRAWSFFLFSKQCPERDIGDFDDFEADTRNITDGVTFTTETSD